MRDEWVSDELALVICNIDIAHALAELVRRIAAPMLRSRARRPRELVGGGIRECDAARDHDSEERLHGVNVIDTFVKPPFERPVFICGLADFMNVNVPWLFWAALVALRSVDSIRIVYIPS